MTQPRTISINIHDAHLGIWQEDANDASFRKELFSDLIRMMRASGWHVGQDPRIKRNYAALNQTHRRASKRRLQATLECTGRVITLESWTDTGPLINPNGQRYGFNNRGRMLSIDRRRLDIEHARMIRWLAERCLITEIKNHNGGQVGAHFGGVDAMTWLRSEWKSGWHNNRLLGRPKVDYRVNGGSNGRSRDGEIIHQGMMVWWADWKGRIRRGRAYYAMNNNWHIVSSRYDVQAVYTGRIYVNKPTDLRRKVNEHERRKRLESELARAIQTMNFTRAETLRRLLFDRQDLFVIWSKKRRAFYAAQSEGYTTSMIVAGKFTLAEARKEASRSRELSIMRLDGREVTRETA